MPTIQPVTLGPTQQSKVFYRFAALDTPQDILNGIHVPHLRKVPQFDSGKKAPDDWTYFHAAGGITSQNHDPDLYEKEGQLILDLHERNNDFLGFNAQREGKKRYEVIIVVKVTPDNFGRFSERIAEEQAGTLPSNTHDNERVTSFGELSDKGYHYAVIDTNKLSREDLFALGDAVQVGIFDTQDPEREVVFRPWHEMVREKEASQEVHIPGEPMRF